MMTHGSADGGAGAIDGAQIAVLPFDGQDLAMIIVLPDEPSGLAAIERKLTAEVVAQWIAGDFPHATLDVKLPRFSVASSLDLRGVLGTLGVTSVFDATTADLSGITGGPDLYVDSAVHKATISVSETGAEAAAATGIGAVPTSVPAPFVADHPFAFLIVDRVTGAVLFMGRVTDPR